MLQCPRDKISSHVLINWRSPSWTVLHFPVTGQHLERLGLPPDAACVLTKAVAAG